MSEPTTANWQDIATAPKDGTTVLLFGGKWGTRYWFTAYWLQADDGSSGWIGSSFWSEPEGNWTIVMDEEVTHWMPLPEPPRLPGAVTGRPEKDI